MKHLLIALTVFLMLPAMAQADHGDFDHDVDVNVNGLVCDFCARALEKVFGKREEVNAIHVDLDNALVAIDLKDGMSIPDEEIKQLITDSGYNVVEIKHVGEKE